VTNAGRSHRRQQQLLLLLPLSQFIMAKTMLSHHPHAVSFYVSSYKKNQDNVTNIIVPITLSILLSLSLVFSSLFLDMRKIPVQLGVMAYNTFHCRHELLLQKSQLA
jgi:hypothetical protein